MKTDLFSRMARPAGRAVIHNPADIVSIKSDGKDPLALVLRYLSMNRTIVLNNFP